LNYPGSLIIISHDRDFLKGLTSRTLEFGGGHIKEYLGDIDEMLAKKGIETLDIIAPAAVKAKEPEPVLKPGLPDAEKKALQKRFNQIEKEIDKLEKTIKEKEGELADPGFYQ
jgi:ATP-binding cassette subfamily F protein 3